MKLRVDTTKLQRVLQQRGRDAVQAGVRVLEDAVRSEIMAGIEGKRGGPRRVRSGRYLASWAPGSPDSTVRVTVSPLAANVTVTNHVPYAIEVEHGSPVLRPGLHLTQALAVIKQQGPQLLRDAMLPALKEE